MPPAWLCVCLALIAPSAGAVEAASPANATAGALSLPSASPRFVESFSGLAGWLRTPEGSKASFRVDPSLSLLGGLGIEAQAAALEPIESGSAAEAATRLSQWTSLKPAERVALLRELSALRLQAAPGAAAALRARVARARLTGASDEELLSLRRQAQGSLVFGGEGAAALAELGELLYERRLAPIEAEVAGFIAARRPEALASSNEGPVRPSLSPFAPGRQEKTKTPPPPAPKKSDLKVRALTAALLVPSLIALIHFGGAAFVALTALLAGLSLREYAGMLKAGARPVQPWIAVISGVSLALTVALHWPATPMIAGVVSLAALRELLRKDRSFERAALTVFGSLLFGFLPAHLALLRGLHPFGERITLMLFSAAWATDTTAYFFGKRWGKRKIAPAISPNKTWEGAAAGFLGALAAVLSFWATAPAMMPLAAALGVSLIMGIAGQASGYLNSMIKRANGVKDSGTLLPGHGGVIDRFDTFILSAALVYYWLALI